jgi:hypothetical protein
MSGEHFWVACSCLISSNKKERRKFETTVLMMVGHNAGTMEAFISALESAVLMNGCAVARPDDCAAATLDFAFADCEDREIDFCISFDFDPKSKGFYISYIRIHCTNEACGIEQYGNRIKMYGRTESPFSANLPAFLTWTHEFIMHRHTKEAPFVVLEDHEDVYFHIKA